MTNRAHDPQTRRLGIALGALALSVAGAAAQTAPAMPNGADAVQGYLPKGALPDSAALLPPPPAEGSAALALDQAISQADLALRDGPRWTLAAMDANLGFPWAAGDFACALGAGVTPEDTPRLYRLLRRTLADAGAAAGPAKNRYNRRRPFLENKQPTCSPADEESLAKNGSYPSGHTTIGWTWALALSEIAPERGDAILARGRAFGDSRLVCNVHWESDVIEGRNLAAGVVARLHDDATFLADLNAAKDELAAARAKGLAPQRDCQQEADALASVPIQGP